MTTPENAEPRIGDTVVASQADAPPVILTIERIIHESLGKGNVDRLTDRTIIVGRRQDDGELFGIEWGRCLLVPTAYASADVEAERLRAALTVAVTALAALIEAAELAKAHRIRVDTLSLSNAHAALATARGVLA